MDYSCRCIDYSHRVIVAYCTTTFIAAKWPTVIVAYWTTVIAAKGPTVVVMNQLVN